MDIISANFGYMIVLIVIINHINIFAVKSAIIFDFSTLRREFKSIKKRQTRQCIRTIDPYGWVGLSMQ